MKGRDELARGFAAHAGLPVMELVDELAWQSREVALSVATDGTATEREQQMALGAVNAMDEFVQDIRSLTERGQQMEQEEERAAARERGQASTDEEG